MTRPPLRIALLDGARTQRERLHDLLEFPHVFVESAGARVIADNLSRLYRGAALRNVVGFAIGGFTLENGG
jgi:hypothetical protein